MRQLAFVLLCAVTPLYVVSLHMNLESSIVQHQLLDRSITKASEEKIFGLETVSRLNSELFEMMGYANKAASMSSSAISEGSSNTGHKPTKAVVTLLLSDNYMPGVMALGRSLAAKPAPAPAVAPAESLIPAKATPPSTDTAPETIPRIVLVSSSVSASVIRRVSDSNLFHAVSVVPAIANPYSGCSSGHMEGFGCNTMLKLSLWALPFEKIVYFDADTIVLNPANTVADLFASLESKPAGLAAAMDCCKNTFNSGVLVVRPHVGIFFNLVSALESGKVESDDHADQGFLWSFFSSPDVSAQYVPQELQPQTQWLELPYAFNFQKNCVSLKRVSWSTAAKSVPAATNDVPSATKDVLSVSKDVTTTLIATVPRDQSLISSEVMSEAAVSALVQEQASASPFDLKAYMDSCNAAIEANSAELRVIHYIGRPKPWECPVRNADCSHDPIDSVDSLIRIWDQHAYPK